jgi:hypothetical protein
MSTFYETEGVPQPDLSLPLFDSDFAWDIFNSSINFNSPPEPSSLIYPPSPSSCDEIGVAEIENANLDMADIFRFPAVAKQLPLKYVSNAEAEVSSFPSPPSSDAQSIRETASPAQQLSSPPPPVPRRRGPGRPSKAQIAARGLDNKNISSRSKIIMRREFHNDSATRSRAKFNGALEKLWKEIPEEYRSHVLGINAVRQVSRADKVETMISFIRKLRMQVENHQ